MKKRLLAVGDSTEIEIVFSSGSRRGRFSKSPRLYTSDPSVTETRLRLKGEIIELLNRHYQSLTVWKFIKGLNRDIEGLFRFVTDKEINATNNISERELRALVIIRKISNGSRSRRGANASAMLLSVIQTLRLQKKNVLKGLCEIINRYSGC